MRADTIERGSNHGAIFEIQWLPELFQQDMSLAVATEVLFMPYACTTLRNIPLHEITVVAQLNLLRVEELLSSDCGGFDVAHTQAVALQFSLAKMLDK